jgi:hypothetical protein
VGHAISPFWRPVASRQQLKLSHSYPPQTVIYCQVYDVSAESVKATIALKYNENANTAIRRAMPHLQRTDLGQYSSKCPCRRLYWLATIRIAYLPKRYAAECQLQVQDDEDAFISGQPAIRCRFIFFKGECQVIGGERAIEAITLNITTFRDAEFLFRFYSNSQRSSNVAIRLLPRRGAS